MKGRWKIFLISSHLFPPTKEREKSNFLISPTPAPWKKDRDKQEQKDQKSLKKY